MLHVAAVKFPDINGRRIFAWIKPYNWNVVLKLLREIKPDHKFPDDIPDPGMDLTTIHNEGDEKLLERVKGSGWTPLKESLDASLKSYGY